MTQPIDEEEQDLQDDAGHNGDLPEPSATSPEDGDDAEVPK